MATDVHCHYVPPQYLRYIAAHESSFAMRWTWLDDERAQLDAAGTSFAMGRDFVEADRHLREMDRLGIRKRVLSLATPLINYRVEDAVAIEGARLVNDELAKLMAPHPERFDAWAYLPMQVPEESARELERAVQELGLGGGHVSSNVLGRYLDDPALDVVFATAAGLDVPLFVHPSNPPGQDRLGSGLREVRLSGPGRRQADPEGERRGDAVTGPGPSPG